MEDDQTSVGEKVDHSRQTESSGVHNIWIYSFVPLRVRSNQSLGDGELIGYNLGLCLRQVTISVWKSEKQRTGSSVTCNLDHITMEVCFCLISLYAQVYITASTPTPTPAAAPTVIVPQSKLLRIHEVR